MEDWHWAMALNQAAALRLGIEHFRSWSPRTAGTVIWQLNDMWPVTSWSAVDGYGRAKPLLYSARHAYADRLVTIQPRGIELVVAIVNDSGSGWVGDLVLDRISFDGAPLATTTLPVSVDARGTLLVGIPADVATAGSAGSEVLVANLDSHRGLWFFADYRDSALAAPALTTEVEAVSDGYDVRVSSAGLVRELSLLVDKLDPAAVVDDLLITLLPGESWTFHVSTAEVLDADELVSPRVLRSANQLVTS
jgi:beta-mannosidase